MRRFLDRARRLHPGKHIAVVSHHHPILFTTLWALGAQVDLDYRSQRTLLGLPERFPIHCAMTKLTYATDMAGEVPTCSIY
jgi:hypothetical protein